MLSNEPQAASAQILLNPVSAANTAAATSSWVDVRHMVGSIMVTAQVGALTGTLAWTVETADDNSGTNGAAITPDEGAFATVAANQVQKRSVNARHVRGFLRIVGTIVTGPAVVSANVMTRPKTV